LIHQKLSKVSIYTPKKLNKTDSDSASGPSSISDGFAAATMMIVSIPLLPILLIDSNKKKEKTINWENDYVGKPSTHLISKLGKPISSIDLLNGDKILSYPQKYFWVPVYVGIHNKKVLWVSHYNINLRKIINGKL